jgi:3-hydroxyacyl-[acyl-carrier-protein] dehydratase
MTNIANEISGKPGHFSIRGVELDLFRPHKYPLVLLENVTDYCLAEKKLRGSKKVKLEDPYVQAHFPGDPCMPPPFVVEALAQCCGALMNLLFYGDKGIMLWEISIQEFLNLPHPPYNVLAEARVKHVDLARPGETIELEAKVALQRKDIISFQVSANVAGRPLSSGDMILAYPPYTPPVPASAEQIPEPVHAAR